jgi:hypothetical protein
MGRATFASRFVAGAALGAVAVGGCVVGTFELRQDGPTTGTSTTTGGHGGATTTTSAGGGHGGATTTTTSSGGGHGGATAAGGAGGAGGAACTPVCANATSTTCAVDGGQGTVTPCDAPASACVNGACREPSQAAFADLVAALNATAYWDLHSDHYTAASAQQAPQIGQAYGHSTSLSNGSISFTTPGLLAAETSCMSLSDAWLRVKEIKALHSPEFTAVAWIRHTGGALPRMVLSESDMAGLAWKYTGWALTLDASNHLSFVVGNQVKWFNIPEQPDDTQIVSTGKVHFVAAALGAHEARLYLDAKVVGDVGANDLAIVDSLDAFDMGNAADGSMQLGGDIADVAYFPRALSDLEIAWLYAVGAPPVP